MTTRWLRLSAGGTEPAAGERIVRDCKGFKLDVDLTKAGKKRVTGC